MGGYCWCFTNIQKIHDYMTKNIIEGKDVKQYKKEMKQFEKDVIEFYKYGANLFIKGHNTKQGGGETTYMHTYSFYVPKLAARA